MFVCFFNIGPSEAGTLFFIFISRQNDASLKGLRKTWKKENRRNETFNFGFKNK